MASIRKREGSWVAEIRTGHKSVSKSFPTKSLASEWARKVESEMDASLYRDNRSLNSITFGDLIDRYTEEIGAIRPFGKNKAAALKTLKAALGSVPLSGLNTDRLGKYVDQRRAGGAGGVTVGIDLTYTGGILKTASAIWKMPADQMAVSDARARLAHLGVSTKSRERTRRPTTAKIDKLCEHFHAKGSRQRVPMPNIIIFAVATAMRLGEIIGLKWADLNQQDRTIIIRNRKHPTEKVGNDQEVPLLGEAWEIVRRQPEKGDRIFPVTEGTVSTIFPRACQVLGIEDLKFHDLRHEGVSRLFEQGYTIEQVALVSGH
ncbi:site-specific integrase [Massilia sp.]|uniref:site-specific integrase n=1 Tax=Massilia sp. TaxID=1882437 RepID=UPI002897E052|nr:site-specific integrase [Massilia sp.]